MSSRGSHERARAAGLACVALALALTFAGLGVATATAGATARGGATPLYPNLVTRPIEGVRIEKAPGVKLLRFPTLVGNRGPGPVELFPDTPDTSDCDGDADPANDRIASQRVFGDTVADGVFTRGEDTDVVDTPTVGCFVFHPAHDHWHFEEFERYVLTRVKTGKMIASSEKVSFCVLDTYTFGDFPGSPASAHYGPCNADVTMGLSVGWYDVYQANLPGQELDIRGVRDGRFCLKMTADPADHVLEANETDNTRSTILRIVGRTVKDRDRRCPGEPR